MWSEIEELVGKFVFRRKFFAAGWGDIARLEEACGLPGGSQGWDDGDTIAAWRRVATRNPAPVGIDIDWGADKRYPGNILVRRGTFATPFNRPLLPEASHTAHVEWVAPADHAPGMPVCVLFAATGEEGFLTRRFVALALTRQGIASLILEAPFYGLRRPPAQKGFFVDRFSDLLAMLDTTIEEGRSLLLWLRQAGYTRQAVSGISMGGSVSALVAARTGWPVAAICVVPAHAVGPVYCVGLLSQHVDWTALGGLRSGRDPRAVMGEYLQVFDVSGYPRPVAEKASAFLSATEDACIPRDDSDRLHACWPQASVEWIAAGHTTGAVLGWNRQRKAILRGLAALA